MTSISPNFRYWSNLPTIKIWEAAVLMCGIDPRAIGDATMSSVDDPTGLMGVPLKFDDELRMLTAAISTGQLTLTLGHPIPVNEQTEVVLDTLIGWLSGSQDYADLSCRLDRSKPSLPHATGFPSFTPAETTVQRQDRRLKQCVDAGLYMDKTAILRLPNGVGDLADEEGVARQTFSADVKAALQREFEEKRAGSIP